ncbi:hypothetical protein BH11CYA1_BH11CYA1_15090 [soil metagenome]
MSHSSPFGRLAFVAIISVALIAILGLGAFAYWYDLEKRIDGLCAAKNWGQCSLLPAGDFSLHWPFVGLRRDDQVAPALLLQNYFLDLAGVPVEHSLGQAVLSPGQTIPSQGQAPQGPAPSAASIAVISERAQFYERQWHFRHLSEAYLRCAVGLYRKQAKASLLQVATNKQGAAESLGSLAKSLRHLAELYQGHGKYLIAERALKECTDVATQAFALADQATAERFRAELLVDYGAHIKILNDLGRTPEAEHESKLLLEQ